MKIFEYILLEILLVASLASCVYTDKEICNTDITEKLLKEYFDVREFDTDFQIIFYSNGGWGGHDNKIDIVKKDSGFKSYTQLITRRTKITGERLIDTIIKESNINQLQIDSLIKLIENLNCKPFDLDQYSSCTDCDINKIFIKKNGTTRAWYWNPGTVSHDSTGSFIDSIKVKATWVEGKMFKLAGFNSSELYYYLKGKCEKDSIEIHIIPNKDSYIIKSVEVNHPKYLSNEFYSHSPYYNKFYSKYFGARIACKDTSEFINDADIFVITKDDEVRIINEIFKRE